MEKEMSLDQMLKRDDYSKLVPTLRTRAESIAYDIRKKMEELDLADHTICGSYTDKSGATVKVHVVIDSVSAKGLGGCEFLAIKRETEYGSTYRSLEDIGKDYYYANDFNARLVGASNKEALMFLNAAKSIIKNLSEVESEQAKDVEDALNNTSKL